MIFANTFKWNCLARRHRRRDLLLRRPPLLYRRRPVALLEIRQNDRKYEFLLTVIVEFDNNIFIATRQNASQTELWMLDLCALREGRFGGHVGTEIL
jgi:hypothetical protein